MECFFHDNCYCFNFKNKEFEEKREKRLLFIFSEFDKVKECETVSNRIHHIVSNRTPGGGVM